MDGADQDRRFMAAAVRLSRWNTGHTATNPSVGCLVVKDGAIVGSGVTAPGGRPHAEPQALAMAGEEARGATVYVTLEPCSHHGKTPPCADALIAAGVARVVIGVTDPDGRVCGRGVAMLEAAGIVVETGILEAECRHALAAYLMRQTKRRPYVTLKLAVSTDGMIGRIGAGQVAITGPISRAQVHALRAETDAILVGIGTARADDPELTCRLPGLEAHSPLRVVVDARLELPATSKMALSAARVPVIVVAAPPDGDEGTGRRKLLEEQGVEILETPDVESMLFGLATRGISSLMVEGGARVARAFLKAGLVDRILLFRGAVEIGADGVESPVLATDMPAGFNLIRSYAFGSDRCDDYERAF